MKRFFIRGLALLAVFLFVVACGGDTPSPAPPGDTDGGDGSDTASDDGPSDGGASDETDDVSDGGDGDDVTDGPDDSDATDGPSTPPETVDGVILCDPQADDCPDGPCVTFDPSFDQGLCGTFCVTDADCPSTFRCVRITVGADIETACLPIDFCLDRDGDGYGFGPGCAGPDCDDNDPDVYFGAPSLCDGKDNNCNGLIDDNPVGTGEDCDTGFPGICSEGRQVCEFGSWSCIARREAAEFETCNGLDTTCDGLVDAVLDDDGNETPLTRQCYEGPSGTEGVGQCRQGTRTCEDGEFGPCEGQVLPSPVELCDGVDNTCNGVVDDSPVGVGTPCDTGLLGLCGEGVNQCINGEVVCVQLYQPAAEETCNGLDTTCDGLVDATLDEDGNEVPLSRRCYDGPIGTEGVGQCRAGARVCVDGQYGECEGQILPAPAEVCDGMDSTCNGLVDDDPVDVGQDCDTGQIGLCGVGRWECQAGERVCAAINRPADVETCSGQDDTCDGLVDQVLDDDGNAVPLTESCYTGPAGTQGVGICTAGIRTCTEGEWSSCAGEVLPREETCNGLDDNCDGLVDNANSAGARLSEQCYEGPEDTEGVGECRGGTRFCVDGDFGECVGQVLPAPVEVCDGRDNTCDGLVDQTAPGVPLSRSCYDGPSGTLGVGVCTGGTQTCEDGEFGRCEGQVLPGVELCNGLDSNCDGTVDSGDPGSGIPCNSGLPGVCAEGVTACVSGELECVANIQPGELPERCNGLDQNCDGTVDSLFPDLGQPCFVGEGICRRSGLNICDPTDDMASPICDATPGEPEPETCNYLDSNCNGIIDSDFRNAQGIYDNVENCGACGVNCLEIFDRPNATGECNVSGGVATCRMVCNPGAFDLNLVPDDGCEFVLDSDAIYVGQDSPGASDDGTCGLGPQATGGGRFPCSSIARGIERAQATGRSRVRIADGAYDESITVANGISLLGGHRADTWERSVSGTLTTVRGTSTDTHKYTIRANAITQPTLIEGLNIFGQNNTATNGNVYTVWITSSGNNLELRGNRIYGGQGGPGAQGQAGTRGIDGVPGTGRTSDNAGAYDAFFASGSGACHTSNNRQYNNGGSHTCGDVDVSGGRGGGNSCRPVFDEQASAASGLTGTTASGHGAGGGGGLGGRDGQQRYATGGGSTVCGLPGASMVGADGESGGTGANGASGTGCPNAGRPGSIVNGHWTGGSGGGGELGRHGGGGGGGGAGGGGRCTVGSDCSPSNTDRLGAHGGGGGAGGCGGDGATGGAAGGGSVAVFVSGGSAPVIQENQIFLGLGGRGGDGGGGGAGGLGGIGGAGGDCPGSCWCHVEAGAGGRGGDGGHGGGGGGGCGGASFGVVVHSVSGAPDYCGTAQSNSLTGGQGGAGGQGGLSLGNNGANGQDGISNNCRTF